MDALRRSRVAFLAGNNLDDANVFAAIQTLRDAGAQVDIIGVSRDTELLHRNPDGLTAKVALRVAYTLDQISAAKYQAVAVPVGLLEDGRLGVEADVLHFVQAMQAEGKPLLCFPTAPEGSTAKSPARGRLFHVKELLADSWQNWNAIDAPRLGAALAYYTMLSLAPLLVLLVVIGGAVLQRSAVQTGLLAQVRSLMGSQVEAIVRSVLDNVKLASGLIAGAVSLVILMVSASGVFLELRDSLDTVWGVKPGYGSGLLSLVRERAFAFLLILGTGLLLLISVSVTTILSAPAHFLMRFVPDGRYVAWIGSLLFSLVALTFLFALVFKVIPDIEIHWSDVWVGGLVTAVLFTLGKFLIGLYLARASIGSPYATAGSLVAFLTWVYYSAQIFLLGAEFTHVYALRHGSYSKRYV